MELIMAATIGLLTACGIYLLLRAHIFSLVFGLTLLSYAVNLFLFAMGRLSINAAPLVNGGDRYADPLPQALVLTAIVIGFAMTAFVVVLALRACGEWGDDSIAASDSYAPGDNFSDDNFSRKIFPNNNAEHSTSNISSEDIG